MFLLHTFTLEALSQQTPQQRPTVVAEGQNFKAVDAEHVRHVDAEPLRSDRLEDTQHNTTQQDTESCIQQQLKCLYLIKNIPYFLHCVLLLLHPRTLGNDQLMAALVDHTGTHCRRNTHTHTRA